MTNPEESPNQNSAAKQARSRTMRRFGLPTAFLVGGLAFGAAFTPIGFASADDDASASTTDDAGAASAGDERPHDGPRGEGDGHRGPHRGERLEALAEVLGMEPAEVREGLIGSGQTIAEFAEANGVSTDELIAGLIASAEERLDQAVADGKVSDEKAEEIRASIEERITEGVNRAPGEDGPRWHRHGPRRGGMHHEDGGPDA